MRKFRKGINLLTNAIENMDKKREIVIAALISLLIVFGVVIGIGTIGSGYHLVDDHEMLRWSYWFKECGDDLFHRISEQLKIEFSYRYRPIYIIMRILGAKYIGTNLTWHALIKALESALAMFLLYFCGKRMGAGKIASMAFALCSLVGYQACTWWKLGTHEIQGVIYWALGMFFMLGYLKNKGRWNAVGSVLAFAIMANYKESFIILAPFVMLYVVYYELTEKEKMKKDSSMINEVFFSIKNNFWYLCALAVVFLIPVFIIIFHVGTNNYDNVGLEAGVPLSTYVSIWKESLDSDLKWCKRFGIVMIAVLLTFWEKLKKLWKEFVLLVAFIFPQLVLYGREGLYERYLLPVMIGLAWFFIIIVSEKKILPKGSKRTMVYVLAVLLLLAAHGRGMLREADYFTYRGHSVTTALETVTEISKGRYNILSCLHPNTEANYTIRYWLANKGYENIYYWIEEDLSVHKESKPIQAASEYGEEKYSEETYPIEDMDIVVMYNREDRHWCYDPTLDLSEFTEIPCGTLTLYVRNDSGVEIPEIQIPGLKIHF